MSKTTLADVDGFTPVIDMIVDDVGLMAAVVFGRVWRYCQMEDGYCNASMQKIADGIGMHYNTAMRHVKSLCDAGYLRDGTPGIRNEPHRYYDTGKAGLRIALVAGPPEKCTKVHQKSVPRSTIEVDEDSLLREPLRDISASDEAGEELTGEDLLDVFGLGVMPSEKEHPKQTITWQERMENEPWLAKYGWVTPRNGTSKAALQRTLHVILEGTGWSEPSKKHHARWNAGLEDVYQEARGDFDRMARAVQMAMGREAGYRPTGPEGIVNAIRQTAIGPEENGIVARIG